MELLILVLVGAIIVTAIADRRGMQPALIIIVVGLALWMEITYEPPIWVHALVAGTLSIGLSLLLVRPLKGVLAALQFTNKAEQGRFR